MCSLLLFFISSTKLAIIAEADFLGGTFLSEKVVVAKWLFPLASGPGY